MNSRDNRPGTSGNPNHPGKFRSFARGCLDSNQRIYLAAINRPENGEGLVDPAVERQVALMILS